MAGLGEDLKVDGEQYMTAVTVPANTTTNGSSILNTIGAVSGAIEVKVVANTDIVISDTKVVSVVLEDSADNITFTTYATIYTVTASGATTVDADTVLALFVLPSDIKKYTRVSVTTNDAGVTGKVDGFPVYLPR